MCGCGLIKSLQLFFNKKNEDDLDLGTLYVDPCGLDFLTSVGIGIGFLRKCRFSVRIGFGFGMEKSFCVFCVFSV
jgi:hypothetical protein